MPMSNTHDKCPWQIPMSIPMTNTLDKHPWQTPMANSHVNRPWQIPMTNAHDKRPRQTPMTNDHDKRPWQQTHVKCPWQTPWQMSMSNAQDKCQWQMPISNNNDKWPWQTTMPFCLYTHVVDLNFNTICTPFSRGHLIFETSNLFFSKLTLLFVCLFYWEAEPLAVIPLCNLIPRMIEVSSLALPARLGHRWAPRLLL